MPDFNLATGFVEFKGNFDKLEADILAAKRQAEQLDKVLNAEVGQQKFTRALYAAKAYNTELRRLNEQAARLQNAINPSPRYLEQQRRMMIAGQNRQNRDETWLARQEAREARKANAEQLKREARQERDETWLARQEARDAKKKTREEEKKAAKEAKDAAKKEADAKREEAKEKAKHIAFIKGIPGGLAAAGAFGAGVGGAALAAGAGGSPLAQSTLKGSFDLLMTTIGGTFTPLVLDASKAMQGLAKSWKEMSKEYGGILNEGAKVIGVSGLVALGLASVAKGLSLIARHPLIAILSGGIGGAVVLNDWLNKKMDSQIAAGQAANMSGFDSVRNEPWTKQLKGMGENGITLQNNVVRNAWLDYQQKSEKVNNYQKGWLGGGGFYEGFVQRISDFTGKYGENITNAALESQKRFEMEKVRLDELTGGKLPRRSSSKNGADILLGSAGQPSMMGVNELFKSFQMAGMGGNQLEAAMKQEQLANQQEMVKSLKTSNELLIQIRDKGGMVK